MHMKHGCVPPSDAPTQAPTTPWALGQTISLRHCTQMLLLRNSPSYFERCTVLIIFTSETLASDIHRGKNPPDATEVDTSQGGNSYSRTCLTASLAISDG